MEKGEVRGQRAEGRGQRAEGRGQTTGREELMEGELMVERNGEEDPPSPLKRDSARQARN
jgi:hypothetical protein